MKTFSHKLGTTRAGEGTRICLEGKRLVDHGFTCGAHVLRNWDALEGKLTLRVVSADVFADLPRDERTTVAGKPERPIIDITGQMVRDTFPTGNVTATWSQGRCVIRGCSAMTRWQKHHAAARRGKRHAQAVACGRPFRGNPYSYSAEKKYHLAWAQGYLRETLRRQEQSSGTNGPASFWRRPMADLQEYECFAPGYPRTTVHACDSWHARKAYARRHGCGTVDVIARRADLVDDKFNRFTKP